MKKYLVDNINLTSVVILYIIFILNLIFFGFYAVDYELVLFGKLVGVTIFLIYIAMPVAIILCFVYLIKKKSILNLILFLISFVPVVSIYLMLFMIGKALSSF